MRFTTVVSDWSLQDGILHRRDARAKVIATFLLIVAIHRGSLLFPIALIAAALGLARLPVVPVLTRACVVLPFGLSFAAASLMSGRGDLAVSVLLRSYFSACAVLVLIGTTPLISILDALRRMGTPDLLLDVVQFVYRYLFLIADQGRRMAIAASARGARHSLTAVAGSVGVLFARSYERAESIHRAMLARGYAGSALTPKKTVFTVVDALLVAIPALAAIAAFL